MPKLESFDITTGVDLQEVDNALNQARKEIVNRFDFKGVPVDIDYDRTVRQVEHIAYGRTRITELEQAASTPYDGHTALIDAFLGWLDGGPAPQTEIGDNIRTAAVCFAAAEASRGRTVVNVRQKLASAGVL